MPKVNPTGPLRRAFLCVGGVMMVGADTHRLTVVSAMCLL